MMDFVTTMIKQQLFYKYIVFCLGLSLSVMVSARCDFDDFPTMDDMKIQSIMEDANYNNRPMMVRQYVSDSTGEQVISFYHKQWEDRYDDTPFGGWYQVSTMTDSCMMTVQISVENPDSASGRLIISNPPTANPNAGLGEDLLKPADTEVVSDLVTDDGPKQGRVSMLTSAESPRDVAAFYRSAMEAKGWHLERDFKQAEAHALVFRNGLDILNVVLVATKDGLTQILLNEVVMQ